MALWHLAVLAWLFTGDPQGHWNYLLEPDSGQFEERATHLAFLTTGSGTKVPNYDAVQDLILVQELHSLEPQFLPELDMAGQAATRYEMSKVRNLVAQCHKSHGQRQGPRPWRNIQGDSTAHNLAEEDLPGGLAGHSTRLAQA